LVLGRRSSFLVFSLTAVIPVGIGSIGLVVRRRLSSLFFSLTAFIPVEIGFFDLFWGGGFLF